MTDFQRDLEVLINEGIIAANNKRIRFFMRYGNRLKGDIELLDLSTRGFNCLKRKRINTIEDVGNNFHNLGRIAGIGITTVKEVKNKYLAYYYANLNTEERKDFWRDTVEATINMEG